MIMEHNDPEKRKLELKAKVFKVFSDPTRLKILEVLREKERNVTEIMDILSMKQSTVSQHLRMLKECGVVNSRRNGREVIYSISDEIINEILDMGERLLVITVENMMTCVCE